MTFFLKFILILFFYQTSSLYAQSELVIPSADFQTENEVKAASEKINQLFPHRFDNERLTFFEEANILQKYDHLDPDHVVPENLLTEALAYFEKNKSGFTNSKYISIVDFKKHSQDYRFFLIDLKTGIVRKFHTTHGEGSDRNDDGFPERFSNVVDSYRSSLGFIRTGEVYSGKFKRSIRLDGLSKTNSRLRERAIVIHGSDHVFESNVKQALTWGCMAFDWKVKDSIIDKIQNGSLIYVGQSLNLL